MEKDARRFAVDMRGVLTMGRPIYVFVVVLGVIAGIFTAPYVVLALEPEPQPPVVAEEPCTWNGKTVEENRPGFWQGEQDSLQAILEEGIAQRGEEMTLEEAAAQDWAPRVGVGPDVTSLDLPEWMRSLIEPLDCTLVAPQEPTPTEEPAVTGMTPEEIARQVALYLEGEESALRGWIADNDPSLTLEEAAQRWVDGNAVGWADTPIAPWGICAPPFLTPASLDIAGASVPEWVSNRIVDYGSGPDCE
jgi:hypothetical protein